MSAVMRRQHGPDDRVCNDPVALGRFAVLARVVPEADHRQSVGSNVRGTQSKGGTPCMYSWQRMDRSMGNGG